MNGTVLAYSVLGATPTPSSPKWKVMSPMMPPRSGPKARLKPPKIQMTAMTPIEMKFCIMMVSTFLRGTMPP